MNNKEKEELIRQIVIERVKSMSPNVQIGLGSGGDFLNRDEIINEVSSNTPSGKKIVEIQLKYIRALKQGIL